MWSWITVILFVGLALLVSLVAVGLIRIARGISWRLNRHKYVAPAPEKYSPIGRKEVEEKHSVRIVK